MPDGRRDNSDCRRGNVVYALFAEQAPHVRQGARPRFLRLHRKRCPGPEPSMSVIRDSEERMAGLTFVYFLMPKLDKDRDGHRMLVSAEHQHAHVWPQFVPQLDSDQNTQDQYLSWSRLAAGATTTHVFSKSQ